MRFRWASIKMPVWEYLRIFLLFLTFFLVFSVASSFLYINANYTRREQLQMGMVSSLEEQVSWMDQFLQDIYSASYNVLSNTRMAQRLTTALWDASNSANNVQLVEQLKNLRFSLNEHIYRIFLYNSDAEKLYYDGGICEPDLYFNEIYRRDTQDLSFWQTITDSNVQIKVLPATDISEKYGASLKVRVLPVSVSRQNQGRVCSLTVDLDLDSLAQMAQERAEVDGQLFFCLDGQQNLLYNTGNQQISKEELAGLQEEALGKGVHIWEEYTLGHTEYYMVGQKGIGGLTYFTMIPLDSFYETIDQWNRPLVFFFVALMVLFFVLAIVYSRKLYHPFRLIAQMSSRFSPENGNGTIQNFETRLGQIDASYQQKEEMLADCLEEGIRFQCMYGSVAFEKRFLSQLHLSDQQLGCIVIQVIFQETYYQSFDQSQQQAIEESLRSLITGLVQSNVYGYTLPLEEHCYGYFFNQKYAMQEHLHQLRFFVEQALAYDREYCIVRAGMSQFHSGDGCLYTALSEAMTAFYAKNEQLLYQPEGVSLHAPFGWKEQNQLIAWLKQENRQQISLFLEELCRSVLETPLYYAVYRQMLFQLTYTGYLFCQQKLSVITAEIADHYRQTDQQLQNGAFLVEDGIRLVEGFFEFCMAQCQQQDEIPQQVARICQYVEEHLAEELYAERIAEAMEYHPKYLSRIFREKMGLTLTDYICQARIERAKHLLLTTSLSVAEVGEQTGFESRTTFFRSFKKLEGISPTEYRKSQGRVR